MARGENTGNHPNRKVDKENSIIRMNKTFALPQDAAGLDAMRAAVGAKLGAPDTGPSLADIRSAVKKDQ